MPDKPKSISDLSKTERKALILEALAKQGYSPYQAAQILGVSKQLTYRIDKQMRAGLLTPLVKKARESVEALVQGIPVGYMTEVKGSDVIAADKMVIDRYEPIVQRIEQKSLKVIADLSDEERQRYQKLLGMTPQPLPVLPEVTKSEKTEDE
jgi:hypothetical protein